MRLHAEFLRAALIWAAAASAIGQVEEAQSAVTHCLAQRADMRLNRVVPHFMQRFAREDDHQRLMEMLSKAGMPD